jgi:hypothetical protein
MPEELKIPFTAHQPYQVSILGFSPYTQKGMKHDIPILFSNFSDPKRGAIYDRSPFSGYHKKIILNNAYQGYKTAVSLEHEYVHIDQDLHFSTDPSQHLKIHDHIAYSRLREYEAYSRHGYKILHDLKTGIITPQELLDVAPLATHINTTLSSFMNYAPSDNDTNTVELLSEYYLGDYTLPSESGFVISNIINLSHSAPLLNNIMPTIMRNAVHIVGSAEKYFRATENLDKDQLYQQLGFILDNTSFNKDFTLNDARNFINRNGTDHFKIVPQDVQELFFENLFNTTPKEETLISSLTARLDACKYG